MPWHLQPTAYTARWYRPGRCYEQRDPPDVIAQVQLKGDDEAYIHATMSREDGSTSIGVWRSLGRMLRTMGVNTLAWDHKRKPTSGDPARAWADTIAAER